MINQRTRRILIDLDETVFPFAHAYHAWLEREKGKGLEWDGLASYDLDAAVGDDRSHDAMATDFLLDDSTLDVSPITKAAKVISELAAAGAEIWIVTARFAAREADATRAWVHRHLPEAADRVLITRTFHGGPYVSKPSLAWAMGATALIDDFQGNFEDLPHFTTGLLVQRPDGLPSDSSTNPGVRSVDWDEIRTHLLG